MSAGPRDQLATCHWAKRANGLLAKACRNPCLVHHDRPVEYWTAYPMRHPVLTKQAILAACGKMPLQQHGRQTERESEAS